MADYTGCEFAEYTERAIREELGRVDAYYGEAFWVAEDSGRVVVASAHQRRGIARLLLATAETYCASHGYTTIVLNTSDLQTAAMRLYEASGYRRTRTASPAETTHKMVGGLVRHYCEKTLRAKR